MHSKCCQPYVQPIWWSPPGPVIWGLRLSMAFFGMQSCFLPEGPNNSTYNKFTANCLHYSVGVHLRPRIWRLGLILHYSRGRICCSTKSGNERASPTFAFTVFHIILGAQKSSLEKNVWAWLGESTRLTDILLRHRNKYNHSITGFFPLLTVPLK